MARFLHIISGMILLALVLTINIAGAANPEDMRADLNVSKVMSSTGPYEINSEVTWAITVRNNGPANATNITIKEDISQLQGLKKITALADRGAYNTSTNVWSIDELKNATFATLTIKTRFSTAGTKTNRISITGLNETDPVVGNNQAEAVVQINTSNTIKKDEPLSAKLVIKPTTLNLKSKGIFTVYVSLYGSSGKPRNDDKSTARIDYANSSLTCSGADMVRASVSNKDAGTLIVKFHRDDLENVTSGDGVKINCSGTLAVNGTMIPVEGSDTIRVIGEKKGLDNILSRLMKFLGLEKDDIEITQGEDGNITVTLHLNPDNFKNPGEAKKVLKIKDNESDTEDVNETAVSDQHHDEKENHSINNGDNKQIRERNTDDKNDTGDKDSNERYDESPGKSNGKKNK